MITAERLMARTERVGECLVWTGATHPKGYGSVWTGQRSELVHRVSYELHFGPIPGDLTVDHVWERGCRHKGCINPAHLELVTRGENVRRAAARLTRCKRGHALTGHNLLLKKRGAGRSVVRNCRTCRDELQQARRALATAA